MNTNIEVKSRSTEKVTIIPLSDAFVVKISGKSDVVYSVEKLHKIIDEMYGEFE